MRNRDCVDYYIWVFIMTDGQEMLSIIVMKWEPFYISVFLKSYIDSMAERSKAPVSGTGHLWRGFESHYCQPSF